MGDKGCSYGLVQINICANKGVSKEEALNPDFALQWASTRLAGGKDWLWTACSCSAYAHVIYPDKVPFQNAKDFVPNGPPQIGGLVIFKYKTSHHVGTITKLGNETFTIREANLTPCKTGVREVLYTDKAIVGFWNP